MARKLFIIGDEKDLALVSTLIEDLKNKGVEILKHTSVLSELTKNVILNWDEVIVVFSPETNKNIFDICQRRNDLNKTTINLFVKPTKLDKIKKGIVGRNHSIYLSISDNLTKEVLEVLDNTSFITNSADIVDEVNFSQINQYDEEGNLILPVYEDYEKKGKAGIILGLIAAACIIGAGIWGYSSYIATSEKKAKEKLYSQWKYFTEYHSGGQVLSTFYTALTKQNLTEFQEHGFHNYFENKFDNPDSFSINQYDSIVEGATINYSTPISIENLMVSELRKLYEEAIASGYNETQLFQPLKELNQSGVITFGNLNKNSIDNLTLSYSPANYFKVNEVGLFDLSKENGDWKISDISKDSNSFSQSLNEYLARLYESKKLTYRGNVYTPAGTFPIQLFIDYSSSPITSLYTNLNYNVTFNLSGNEEEGYINLESKNEKEIVNFKLQKNNGDTLIGKFSANTSSGVIKTYDTVLRLVNENEELNESPNLDSIIELVDKGDD